MRKKVLILGMIMLSLGFYANADVFTFKNISMASSDGEMIDMQLTIKEEQPFKDPCEILKTSNRHEVNVFSHDEMLKLLEDLHKPEREVEDVIVE